MPVLRAFRDEAAGRGLLSPDAPLDAEAAFGLVREMPWTASTGALPEMTLGAWRGDDAGKHYLLRAVLYELGYRSILLACTHAWSVESAPWARAELRSILDEGPVPDVHTFLRVEHDGDWGSVDATWPLGTRPLGLPANERFVPGARCASPATRRRSTTSPRMPIRRSSAAACSTRTPMSTGPGPASGGAASGPPSSSGSPLPVPPEAPAPARGQATARERTAGRLWKRKGLR